MKLRVCLGLLTILALAAWSLKDLSELVVFLRDNPDYTDEVSLYETRFVEIKTQLPGRGTVGYRTDPPTRVQGQELFVFRLDGTDKVMDYAKSYLLAQYALAPVVVDRRSEHPLTLHNSKEGVRLIGPPHD